MIIAPRTTRVQVGQDLNIVFDTDLPGTITWAKLDGPTWLTFSDSAVGACSGTAVAGAGGLLTVTATSGDTTDTVGVEVVVLASGLQVVFDGGGQRDAGEGLALEAPPGEAVSALPEVHGELGAVLWRLGGGPPGWTVDEASGLASGPMPATASSVVVVAQDSRGRSGRGVLTLTPTAATSFEASIEGVTESPGGGNVLRLVAGENVDKRILAPGSTPPLAVALEADPSWAEVVQGTATAEPRLQGTARAGANGLVSLRVTDADGDEAVASAWAEVTEAVPLQLVLPESISDEAGSPIPPGVVARTLGGTAPFTFAVTLGPSGVAVDEDTGELSGNFPATTGAERLFMTVTDDLDTRAFASMDIISTVPAFSVTYQDIAVTAGNAVSVLPTASGGTALRYIKVDGPTWLAVNTSNGRITGTAPNTPEAGVLRVYAESTTGQAVTVSVGVTVAQGALSCTVPAIAAVRGVAGRRSITVVNAPAGFTASKVSGPDWASVSANGTISWGRLTASDVDTSDIVVSVARTGGGTTTCRVKPTISDTPAAITCSITGPSNIEPQDSSVFRVTTTAVGSVQAYTMTASGGTVTDEGGGRFRVTNTTDEGGNVVLSASVTVRGVTSSTCTLTVRSGWAVTCTAPTISITQGSTINAQMSASGRPGSTFTYASADLPAGVTLSASGAIGGGSTLTARTEAYSFTVTVTDSFNSLTGACSVVIRVSGVTLVCSAPSVSAETGATVSGSASASGGSAPYTYSASGLPTGVSMSSAGALSGSSTSVGNHAYTVTVTDSTNATNTCTGTITITNPVLSCPASPDISTSLGVGINTAVSATGAIGTVTYSKATGPTWLNVSATGSVSSTVTGDAGTYSWSYTATASNGTCTGAAGTITVTQASLSCTAESVEGFRGESLSASVSASGGSLVGYTFALASGTPSGISLSGTTVTLAPQSADRTVSYTINVTDSDGNTSSCTGTFTVEGLRLTITAPTLSGDLGQAVSGSVTVTGGTPPYSGYAVSGQSWLSISTGGQVTGTIPSTLLLASEYTYTVSVRDSAGAFASATGTIVTTTPTCSLGGPDSETVGSLREFPITLSHLAETSASLASGPTGATVLRRGFSWLLQMNLSSVFGGTVTGTVNTVYEGRNVSTCSKTVTSTGATWVNWQQNITAGQTYVWAINRAPGRAVTVTKTRGPSWVTITGTKTFPTVTVAPPVGFAGQLDIRITVVDDDTSIPYLSAGNPYIHMDPTVS